MRRLALAPTPMAALAVLVLAVGSVAAPALAAPGVTVAIDHSTRLQISRPAGSVIVGNPAVADVTVVDHHTLFISGRGYGVSEVIVLDPLGRTVWQGDVVVTAPMQSQVSVYRGSQVTEMACASLCTATMRSPAATKTSGAGGGSGAGINPALPSPAGAPQPSPMLP